MRAWKSIVPALVLLAVAACGDDSVLIDNGGQAESSVAETSVPTPSTTTTTGADVTTTTTTPPPTTTTTTPPPPTTTTTTAPPGPTAADTLAAFFAAAEDLDRRIRDAAGVFNAGFDESAVTLDPGVRPVVDALDVTPLRELVPGGLSSDLEPAVLAVFADLDSRISALAGGVRHVEVSELDWALDCLAHGGTSADRFPGDLSEAKDLAGREPPPTAAPDSEAVGIVTVRLEAIQSMNWGCDSCGGVQYDVPFDVDWAGRTVLGANFDAAYDGSAWDIVIYAC